LDYPANLPAKKSGALTKENFQKILLSSQQARKIKQSPSIIKVNRFMGHPPLNIRLGHSSTQG
jgi:hypothetical protein